VLVLSLAIPVAFPIVSNQNQYLAHTQLGPSGDWLVSTTDPYPPFTWLASTLIQLGDLDALRLFAWMLNVIAVAAFYTLSRTVLPQVNRQTAAVALVMCVATLSPLWSRIPMIGTFDVIMGVAGQYTLSAYAQPASLGVLILAALPTWIKTVEPAAGAATHRELLVATILTSVACAFHPTYLISVAIGLATAFVVRLPRMSLRSLVSFVAVGLAALLPSIALNPSILSLAGGGSPELDEALRRFAFERIPHHTLISAWSPRDLGIVLVSVGAVAILLRTGRTALAAWLGLAVGVVVASALFVSATESVKVALMFPWRVSVFLAPVAAVVLATALARAALSRIQVPTVAIGLAAVLLGASGYTASLRQVPVSEKDDAVVLVHTSGVRGVGFIPLDQENIRLNASVPVYVDWKSPPYAGEDLVEWWRRVDQTRGVEQDPESFCAQLAGEVDWVLLESNHPIPSCLGSWTLIPGGDSSFVLYRAGS